MLNTLDNMQVCLTNIIFGGFIAYGGYLVPVGLHCVGDDILACVDANNWDLFVLHETEHLERCLGFVLLATLAHIVEDFAQEVLTWKWRSNRISLLR